MASFLEGSLAQTLYDAMKDTVAYDILFVPVTETDDGTGGYTKVDGATVTAKGFIEDYKEFHRVQAKIPVGDRKVWLFQRGPMVGSRPAINDKVTVRGETFLVVAVAQEPAQALWELQARPI